MSTTQAPGWLLRLLWGRATEFKERNKLSGAMREKITRSEVQHVAKLARLALTDQEEGLMTDQINNILSYMDKLNELDTTGIEPTTHAIQLQNVFRPDQVAPSLDRQTALGNAPRHDGVSFVVPKVF